MFMSGVGPRLWAGVIWETLGAFLESDVFSLLEIEGNHSSGMCCGAILSFLKTNPSVFLSEDFEHSIFCWCSEDTLVFKVG